MLLIGLAKGLALVAVAGIAGISIGYGLSKLSGDDQAAVPAAGDGATATTTPAGPPPTAGAATTTAPATATATTEAPPPPPATTTAPAPAPATGLGEVEVRVLGAVLRPAGEPSGVTPQDGEIVMRVRAENRGSQTVTIEPPVLQIGSVRAELDPATLTPETQFGELAAGETKAVSLKFQITGEATPKATRDRRARIEIAGRSEPLRIKVSGR